MPQAHVSEGPVTGAAAQRCLAKGYTPPAGVHQHSFHSFKRGNADLYRPGGPSCIGSWKGKPTHTKLGPGSICTKLQKRTMLVPTTYSTLHSCNKNGGMVFRGQNGSMHQMEEDTYFRPAFFSPAPQYFHILGLWNSSLLEQRKSWGNPFLDHITKSERVCRFPDGS